MSNTVFLQAFRALNVADENAKHQANLKGKMASPYKANIVVGKAGDVLSR